MQLIEKWQKWDVGGWRRRSIAWPLYALAMIALLTVLLRPAQAQGAHSAVLTWTLSTDDVTTSCTAGANCLQNVYRAPGACSPTSSFTLLTPTALGATVTTFTDSTITPGSWCYGVTFEINGLESAKDTATVTLQPSAPTGITATAK